MGSRDEKDTFALLRRCERILVLVFVHHHVEHRVVSTYHGTFRLVPPTQKECIVADWTYVARRVAATSGPAWLHPGSHCLEVRQQYVSATVAVAFGKIHWKGRTFSTGPDQSLALCQVGRGPWWSGHQQRARTRHHSVGQCRGRPTPPLQQRHVHHHHRAAHVHRGGLVHVGGRAHQSLRLLVGASRAGNRGQFGGWFLQQHSTHAQAAVGCTQQHPLRLPPSLCLQQQRHFGPPHQLPTRLGAKRSSTCLAIVSC